ncbi:unnamed protein product [Owenia fusiformis]|uniref:Uncharacterized protein n=1 Tax=Owenia fusiformis TaxID=6347 RepID=A0A8J1T6T2_OWEFU|nr:unnamed protein product [Owenia fusiformis]
MLFLRSCCCLKGEPECPRLGIDFGLETSLISSKSSKRSRKQNGFLSIEMPHKVRELHCAVMSNDREKIRMLISQGVDINYPWSNPSNPSVKDGCTPLLCAVSLNHGEIVELLISAGAYINKCDRNGCTPIFKAAFHGRPNLIERLARSGADVNLADNSGRTPLYICVHNAIVHSCNGAVMKLVGRGAIIDKCDHSGRAPLHVAAHWKLSTLIELLFRSGEKREYIINMIDNSGRTPLYMCMSSLSTTLYKEDLKHQLPCAALLYKNGADMLNLTEWIKLKGDGIPNDIISSDSEFSKWYKSQANSPLSLKNLCRKAIQKRLKDKGSLVVLVRSLPLPPVLTQYVSRKLFHRHTTRSMFNRHITRT